MREGYKVTEVGDIPESWEIIRLGDFTSSFAGGTPLRSNEDYFSGGTIPWLKSGEVNQRNIITTEEKITAKAISESAAKIIPSNSVVVALYGATAGNVGMLRIEASSNQAVLAVIPKCKELYNEFLYHYLRQVTPKLLSLTQGSGQPNLSKGIVDKLQIPLPPLPEQQKIASILSTVDEKIENIDAQISQTQELKKGLMQQLLTKGIGHTKFKSSELGDIPESWEVVKLGEIAKCFVGIASSATHAYSEKGILLIRNQNIKEGWLNLNDKLFVTEEYEMQHRSKRLRAGDILTVRTGYPGISAVVPSELEGCQSFTTLITRLTTDKLASYFLCYYINSEKGKSFFTNNQAGNGQQNVGSKTLENMVIPVPASCEQRKIVIILQEVDRKISSLQSRKETYQLLKKGLMQQLLTGKIRVKLSSPEPALA